MPQRTKSGKNPKKAAKPTGGERPPAVTLISLLAGSIRERTFLRLVLSQPLSKSESAISKVTVRLVEVGGETKYQWAVRSQLQEKHENLTMDELIAQTKSVFGVNLGDAHLFTTQADLTVRWNYGKPQKVKRKPPTQQPSEGEGHNRQKQYLIPAGIPCPFLIEIGVMLPSGQVRPTMYHKFRQINRYLEFVEDILPQLPSTGPIHVVDFGCGKSYLTFALHHLLTRIHEREVKIVGLDVKADVIDDCTRVAESLKCDGIEFHLGRIETYVPSEQVHLAVSLHACDTATDDAIAAALRWKSNVILAVPCCQHEICQTISRQSLIGLTEYGILKERFASLATDALRAQFLELQGYKTQVLEFIETEHTPKNLLIRSVRRTDATAQDLTARREAYEGLKDILGVKDWHLERAVSSPK
ncbi:class I SAM-dependent methyltransferase [Schlesneria sp. T3-172]|uniref:class I SAM-dependent methyltransferase n=1 Tax=Schlesneria sphaerica TaxID=3373610 RepID=UPI0037C72E47